MNGDSLRFRWPGDSRVRCPPTSSATAQLARRSQLWLDPCRRGEEGGARRGLAPSPGCRPLTLMRADVARPLLVPGRSEHCGAGPAAACCRDSRRVINDASHCTRGRSTRRAPAK